MGRNRNGPRESSTMRKRNGFERPTENVPSGHADVNRTPLPCSDSGAPVGRSRAASPAGDERAIAAASPAGRARRAAAVPGHFPDIAVQVAGAVNAAPVDFRPDHWRGMQKMKSIPDKAEVALEYPDKFYVGTFEHASRFEAHLDQRPSGSAAKRSAVG